MRPGSDTRLRARVPVGAVTGPISVVTAAGSASRPTLPLAILPPPPPAPNPVLSPVPGGQEAGAPGLETGTSRTKAYVGARRAVTFSFRLSGVPPASLSVELVRASDGAAVKSWTPAPAVPGRGAERVLGRAHRLQRGQAGPLLVPAHRGQRERRRGAQRADGQRRARRLRPLRPHVPGPRRATTTAAPDADFGSGRAGHSHQGHDVFAECGTPMVAARGGKVKFKQYHAAAGNYVVIDGAASDVDYVYMHLAEPSPFAPGDRVYTGQRIGAVGETGNARGCHLHFELWGAPGWYDGGKPFDPLPSLQAWDSWS